MIDRAIDLATAAVENLNKSDRDPKRLAIALVQLAEAHALVEAELMAEDEKEDK